MIISYAFTISALILTLTMAWIANYIGLSTVIGAFFSGLILRQVPHKKEINSTIAALGYSTFIPVFFTNIGLSLTFANFLNHSWFIIMLTILALFSKFWAGKYSSQLFGFTKKEADIVGAGMVSRGEVALIIAQIGISYHLFSNNIYSSLIIVIIITTVISPFVLNYFIKENNN